MELQLLPQTFSVCKLRDLPGIGAQEPYCFLGVTDDEISLVCPLENVPVQTIAREDGWRGFRVRGKLDFSLIGVIASISSGRYLSISNMVLFVFIDSPRAFVMLMPIGTVLKICRPS